MINRPRSNEEIESKIQAVQALKHWKKFLGIIISIIIDYWEPLETDGQTSLGHAAGVQVILPWCLSATIFDISLFTSLHDY